MNLFLTAAIAAFIVLLGLLTVCGQKGRRSNEPETQPTEQGATSTSYLEDRAGPESNRSPAEPHNVTPSEERNEFRDCVQIYLQILALCGLAIYCYFTYGLWIESQKQTASAARGWLGFTQQGVDNLPVVIDNVQTSPSFIVDAHYTIENFGNGPAIKVMQSSWIETDPKMIEKTAAFACEGAKRFSTGTVPMTSDVHNPGPMGYILFPKQTHSELIHWRGNDPQSGQWIYVIGCVAYVDQFRKWHWTRFCVLTGTGVIPLPGGSKQTLCTLYNDTDETGEKDESQ